MQSADGGQAADSNGAAATQEHGTKIVQDLEAGTVTLSQEGYVDSLAEECLVGDRSPADRCPIDGGARGCVGSTIAPGSNPVFRVF